MALSCGSDTDEPGRENNVDNTNNVANNADPNNGVVQRDGLFETGVVEVTLEVDYVAGAEPYTEYDGLRNGSPWELTRANLERMFEANGAALTIPTQLDQMEEVSAEAGPYSTDEILALAEANRDANSTGSSRAFYIIFLDDFYEENSGTREEVLGVSIGDTGVIAMFKPVIAGTGGTLTENVRKFVEQTTLIHEFGHAAGLVNNGLPMVDDHHDEENGAHCTNDECVMYFANEGANDLVEFVRRFVIDGTSVVFGAECLSDVDAASE